MTKSAVICKEEEFSKTYGESRLYLYNLPRNYDDGSTPYTLGLTRERERERKTEILASFKMNLKKKIAPLNLSWLAN